MTTSDQQPGALAVRLLKPAASEDVGLVDHLTRLINDVYAVAERGLWRDGTTRTTPSEVADLIRAAEIAVATRDGEIAGCVRLHDVAADASEFAMLVSAPERRSTGVGRALVAFAEDQGRRRGLRAMQLELLVPLEWRHPSKEFLKGWYGRLGYRLIESRRVDEAHPRLAPLLATRCEVEVYEKPVSRRITRCG